MRWGLGCSPSTGDQRDLASVVRAGHWALPQLGGRLGIGGERWGVLASPDHVVGGIRRGAEGTVEGYRVGEIKWRMSR